MYHIVEARIREALRQFLVRRELEDLPVVTQRQPSVSMGEVASPIAFEMAKRLRRAPRQIAQEIAAELADLPGIARVDTAGAGYVNFYLDRAGYFSVAAQGARQTIEPPQGGPKTVVEHTNINPNKAAHIGHLRNAVLGDTLDAAAAARRAARRSAELHRQYWRAGRRRGCRLPAHGKEICGRRAGARGRAALRLPFAGTCTPRVTHFYEEDRARLALRASTLAAIEEGQGAAAELAEVIAVAVTRCHLRTMQRLSVEYDVLPRESEILHLKFWEAAFQQLKERGAIHRAETGKNAGCWVMNLAVEEGGTGGTGNEADDDAKVIVRSNGTVTYVGKDIAYQMWKFGLLGRDFAYRKFHTYPSGHVVWTSAASDGETGAPSFGRAMEVFNVIDTRQAYLQNVVVAGLRALGFKDEAARSTHFSYEIVALSPRCAAEMGYTLSEEDARKPYVEVSGRKGLGVKADDLLDRLEAAARAEVDPRHADASAEERERIAHAIAIGALRYFLLKYTRTAIIAFDFRDALSFEGETGPYCQYAVVRARNIFRKAAEQRADWRTETLDEIADAAEAATWLAAPGADDLWELVLLAGSLDYEVAAAVAAQEPAFLMAKYAFQLAQAFNLFYHRHRILSEPRCRAKAIPAAREPAGRARQLVRPRSICWGIAAPEKM